MRLVKFGSLLVVAGLISGSLTAATAMRDSAAVQAFATQISKFDVALGNYQAKFHKSPADLNKDGLITDADGKCARFSGEVANYWPELQKVGIDGETKQFASKNPGDVAADNPYAPKSAIGQNAGIVVCGQKEEKSNFYSVSSATPKFKSFDKGWGINGVSGAITPLEAIGVDMKMDDAIANSGAVRGIADSASNLLDNTPHRDKCFKGSSYNIDASGPECGLRLDLLISTY